MAVLGVPRPPSFCSQGEKLCEITLALSPLKKFTNLRVISCVWEEFYFKSDILVYMSDLNMGLVRHSGISWVIL